MCFGWRAWPPSKSSLALSQDTCGPGNWGGILRDLGEQSDWWPCPPGPQATQLCLFLGSNSPRAHNGIAGAGRAGIGRCGVAGRLGSHLVLAM